ncbi:hypothetical protein Tco_1080450 [Tanacetum coccineum]|uniref:Integrase, catalytic region, zinc finger, CCHC-type, peptidase aspartic, catalytic n=1 Tax=Tanacetum coccineum TaxID=301880 RepID=A0ABQ5HWA5_9ASTR
MLEKSMYDSWASHDYDVQARNIILHGLPPDVYALVNHQEAAKDIWDRVKLLMKGTELSYQERECRLYNLFDKFAYQVQVNTKFLNALPSEWSKFITDMKLAKSLYTTNYDQLYAYLSQHERHANEVRITRERYPNPLALVANSQTLYIPSQSPQHSVSAMYPPPQQFIPVYAAPVKMDMDEIETLNIELDHRVSKLIAENEHLKQTYKQLYDSIKPTREKGLIITALKNDLRKLKGKALVDNVVTKHIIDPTMIKVDVEPIAPKLLNNRTAHSDYLRHTQEQAAILREELLIIIRQTCPSINNSCDKLVVVTPKNKDKRVRFTEPVTSSGNTNTKTDSSSNLVSNKPVLSSTRVKPSTSASGSQPSGNTKKNKIQRPPSSTQKNKVEAHPRTVKSSLKNKNYVVELKGTANVQQSKLNANSELICVKCNGCMLFDNHDLCVLNVVNAHAKSKSIKKISKRKVWKPTGKVFAKTGYTWRPTGRIFTIVGNVCPLTRITTTTEVPPRKPTALEIDTPKPVVTLVYLRNPRKSKTNDPVSKPKIISANNKEPSKSWGYTVFDVPSSSLDDCRLSKLFSGIWTLAAPSI